MRIMPIMNNYNSNAVKYNPSAKALPREFYNNPNYFKLVEEGFKPLRIHSFRYCNNKKTTKCFSFIKKENNALTVVMTDEEINTISRMSVQHTPRHKSNILIRSVIDTMSDLLRTVPCNKV